MRNSRFLIFGNDGYTKDPRAQREVAAIREHIKGKAEELAFGLCEVGYSWAMVVQFHEPFTTAAAKADCCNVLTEVLCRAWRQPDQSATRGV